MNSLEGNKDFAMYCAIKWIMNQKGFGRVKTREVIDQIDDIQLFSFGSYSELNERYSHLGLPLRAWIQKRDINLLKIKYEEQLKDADGMIHYWDHRYPQSLKEVNDPPLILYYKGNVDLLGLQSRKVGMVGTRCPTDYGRKYCSEIGKIAARSGITVVSGMAMGIDAVAHISALEVDGNSIGVLGCGIDQCYPKQNTRLYQDMKKKGLLITEYEAKVQPHPIHFPERNRIIAGLSDFCIVIEAAKKSGSLITAEMVMDLGREVMALPGPIYSEKSAGCHYLIRSGAEPIIDLEDLKHQWRNESKEYQDFTGLMLVDTVATRTISETLSENLSSESKLIVEMLRRNGQASTEELMGLTGLTFGVLMDQLEFLESNKIVKSFGFLYHL